MIFLLDNSSSHLYLVQTFFENTGGGNVPLISEAESKGVESH